MTLPLAIFLIVFALLMGAGIAFLFQTSKLSGLKSRLADRDSRFEEQSKLLAENRAQIDGLLTEKGAFDQSKLELNRVNQALADCEISLESLRLEFTTMREERIGLEAELESERRLIAERESVQVAERARLLEDQKKLEDAFAKLSSEALTKVQSSFLELANEKFKDARKVSQQEIDKVLVPVKETLTKLEGHTREIELKRTESYAELSQQLGLLMGSTKELTNALRRPEGRGSWGELALRRAAEAAGLQEGVHFELQVTIDTEDGRLRPDMVVNLTENRKIVVDSKVPFEAFQTAHQLPEGAERDQKLKDHARQVKKHIDGLSSKAYQSYLGNTVDFVVMFMPTEAIYHAAMHEDIEMLEYALAKRVILANPMTLVALLRTVGTMLQQQRAFDHALEIAKVGGDLHDAVVTFMEHYESVGESLNRAAKKYNEGLGSINRNLMPKTRTLKKLGARAKKEAKELPTAQMAVVPALPSSMENEANDINKGSLFESSAESTLEA